MPTAVEVVNHSVFLHVTNEHGNPTKVIIGGADGILITIDANGHIHVTPPEGPGDPEVRQAVTSILQGIQVINRLGGGVSAIAATH
jgi:hypothetical protein